MTFLEHDSLSFERQRALLAVVVCAVVVSVSLLASVVTLLPHCVKTSL